MLAQRPRWEASQRPLFVRTVVRNGVRHAILWADDPLAAPRPRPPPLPPGDEPPAPPPRPSELERCLMKLQLVLAAAEPKPKQQTQETTPEATPCAQVSEVEAAEAVAAPEPSCSSGSSSEDEQEDKENLSDEPAGDLWLPDLNPLSERVLQWLEREASRNRPRLVDLRTLRRAQRSPARQVAPVKAPRLRVRRKVAARWCPKLNEALSVHPAPRKPSGGLKVTAVRCDQGRPQLHVFIPRVEEPTLD
ncbi:diacylglycerol kinase kappa-like isoform X2 [Cloeon dipterum]|uniref:diacylglycerol kinase kappa-like isoform X2 n=1 Tax=Cloeon dipterum TaxID=197152 RepID=UPI0032200577